jgi:hypothetical protein
VGAGVSDPQNKNNCHQVARGEQVQTAVRIAALIHAVAAALEAEAAFISG